MDSEIMKKREELHSIEIPSNDLTLNQAKEYLKIAQTQWNEVKERKKEIREKYLLDHYNKQLSEEDLNDKHKSKILRSMAKQMKHQHSFQYLTKHIGRGPKNSLKRVHIPNENNSIERTLVQKEEIEQVIIQHNIKHYSQALDTPMYKDKIYDKL